MSGYCTLTLFIRTLAVSLLLAACTVRPLEFGDSATDTDASTTGDTTTTSGAVTTLPGTGGSTSTDPTTGPAVTTTSAGTTGDGTTGDTTHSFIIEPDGGPEGVACDPWVQDCPEGQKCMPYSGDGDNSWESLKCVEVVPDPAGLYEPCTAGPISSGMDTCAEGLMCWNVDPDTGMGTCFGMCIGSPDVPACADPAATCHLSGDGVLTLCLPQCNPLLQDCPGDDLCIPNPQNRDNFLCIVDASGEEGQALDPCEFANVCDPGLLCIESALAAAECDPMISGCCTPFCDTTLPNTCPGAGQECLPWYEQGQAPPGLEDVGFCSLPMP